MKSDWKEKIANAPESFKARNPHLYQSVAELRTKKPEPDQRSQGQDQGMETGKKCPTYCILFTVYRTRLLDEGDNAASALKCIRDGVVAHLGLPDDSPRSAIFQYHQIKSDRIQGTHILIQKL
jgi:hypothetical protein